ncbi:MAG: hypothetical protein KKB59_18605, partial [Spirochaetes bacterium]|nr:hypothetical protein [Spirochaetota bacterium]
MKAPREWGYKSVAATEEVLSFCGWDYLLRLIGCCRGFFEKSLLSALFETGGRVSEVIETGISCFEFHAHSDIVVMRLMPPNKRWRRDKKMGKTVYENIL